MDDDTSSTVTASATPHTPSNQSKTSNRVKVSVYVGIFLLSILYGIPWVWGNLNTYVISYYYDKGDDSSLSSINWLISIDSFGFNTGLLLGGVVSRTIGIRVTMFLAVIGFNSGVIFSYFTMQHSAIALCSTFGVLSGICGGIVENCQLTLIVRWTDRYRGLAASSIPSTNILGSVVMNFVLTLFINPSNDKPDATRDDISIFSQPDLIHRVPYSFLLYGCLSLTLSLIGLLLIRTNRGDGNFVIEMINKLKTCLCVGTSKEEAVNFNNKPSAVCYESLHNNEDIVEDQSEVTPEILTSNNISNNLESDHFHITPKQALKTRAFYVLWISCSILTYGFFILNTYYKLFGLRTIPDDHFLALVVTVKCIATPIFTWIAGFCMDKFGFKPTMVFVSSLFCILSSFYSLTDVNKWLFLFSTVSYGSVLFSLFCLTSACCYKLYGESHFSTIFGMIATFSNVVNFAIPPVTQWILSSYGWTVLFCTVGVLALCQVVMLVLGLPAKQYFRK